MPYRETAEKLAAFRREIAALREKMRAVQKDAEPEQVEEPALHLNGAVRGSSVEAADPAMVAKDGELIFEAVLTLYDADGRRIREAHDPVRRDPTLDFTPAEDADYLLSVHDFLYRGGGQYGYRLVLTTEAHAARRSATDVVRAVLSRVAVPQGQANGQVRR